MDPINKEADQSHKGGREIKHIKEEGRSRGQQTTFVDSLQPPPCRKLSPAVAHFLISSPLLIRLFLSQKVPPQMEPLAEF
ncbi:hypothetical protein VNO78_07373 [Psophocarpus tetragonolobus]|uniref:Uncharacterized protein n=1 Tax=Psophocarpus tetragonolobus TaxID=3891 RepID=A0AAN9SW31_PSOTE